MRFKNTIEVDGVEYNITSKELFNNWNHKEQSKYLFELNGVMGIQVPAWWWWSGSELALRTKHHTLKRVKYREQ